MGVPAISEEKIKFLVQGEQSTQYIKKKKILKQWGSICQHLTLNNSNSH